MRPLRRRTAATLSSIALAAGALLGGASAAHATASLDTCANVVGIIARGTNEAEGMGRMRSTGIKIQNTTSYPLRLKSLDYPATAVAPNYGLSVLQGEDKLKTVLANINNACPATDFVLMGYSQGAHVIGDTLDNRGPQLSSSIANHIKAVVLYGDPTFNGGEKFNRGTFSASKDGRFARPDGDLSRFASKIASWCIAGDPWCQGGSADVHDTYFARYDSAATSFVIGKLGR